MTENMKKYLMLLSKDADAEDNNTGREDAFFEKLCRKLIEDAAKRGVTLTTADFADNAYQSENELEVVGGATMFNTHCVCYASGVGTAG